MEDINYFKDFLELIPYYRKIVLLSFFIKRDDSMLRELGLSDDFIEELFNDCRQIMDSDMNEYFSHIKNLEESILEKIFE